MIRFGYRHPMGIFDRGQSGPKPGDANWPKHQHYAHDLWDAFVEHDQRALSQLSPKEQRQQHMARWALYDYIDEIWESAKRRGLDPALLPEWQAVAAMRDLADHLANAVDDPDLNET